MLYTAAHGIALCLYVLVAALHLRGMNSADAPQSVSPTLRFATLAGLGVHASTLLVDAVLTGLAPGFAASLSFVAAALMGVLAVLHGLPRARLSQLGVLLAPSAAVFVAASLVVPTTRIAASDLGGSPWLSAHLAMVFVAVAGFVLEFFVSGTQWVVRRRLKRKDLASLHRLPSLDALDRLQFRALVFGLGALTLGIAFGAVFAAGVLPHQEWITDPKVGFTSLVWCWYAVSLGVRLVSGWHGRWSLAFSLLGFVGLLFSLVGLDFLTGGFHAYGG